MLAEHSQFEGSAQVRVAELVLAAVVPDVHLRRGGPRVLGSHGRQNGRQGNGSLASRTAGRIIKSILHTGKQEAIRVTQIRSSGGVICQFL